MTHPHGLSPDDVRAIKVAWQLHDAALKKDQKGQAKNILAGLKRRARELGLKVDDLRNL